MGAADQVLSVQLTMTPETATTLQRETGALEVAQAYVVDSPEMADLANSELRLVKERTAKLKELKAAFVLPAKQIIGSAEALFDPPLAALDAAEKYLKGQLIAYTAEQARIADEARRARDAEERKRRQEAEAKAAAERAKAEEIAREERRKAEEAEKARVAALAEGNAKAAAKAASDAAAAEARGRAAIENAEVKATQIELAAVSMPSTVVVPEAQKLEGFSTRDNWVAELNDSVGEDQATLLIAQALAAGRTELLPLLKRDPAACNRLAKAQKKSMNVPGMRAVNRPVAASRA